MSNYSVLASWGSKDALATGTPAKLVSATELGLEFAAIATMSATKEDSVNKGVAGGYAPLDGSSKSSGRAAYLCSPRPLWGQWRA